MYMILFYKAYKARKISSQTSVTMHSPSCSSIATVEINANMIETKTLLTKNHEKSRNVVSGEQVFK